MSGALVSPSPVNTVYATSATSMTAITHFFGKVVLIRQIRSPEQLLSMFPHVVTSTVSHQKALRQACRVVKSFEDDKNPAFKPSPATILTIPAPNPAVRWY